MRLRAIVVGIGLAVAGVAIGFFITRFLTPTPALIEGSPSSTTIDGRPVVDVQLTTVGSVGSGPHPNWVSYLNSNGDPDTYIHVPAGSVVRMTIEQQDSETPLRNEYFGLVRGTLGSDGTTNTPPSMTIQCDPTSKKDPNLSKYCGSVSAIDPTLTAHTFTIPDLGVSVPLLGVANVGNNVQNTVTVEFIAPSTPGEYRWQCFVPCGAGTLYGNGGPMQTLGYMAGELQVS